MKIQLNRDKEELDVKKITIILNDTEFELEINQFNELVITKQNIVKANRQL